MTHAAADEAFEARIDELLATLGEPGEDLAGLLVAWHGPAVRALAAALTTMADGRAALADVAGDPVVAAVLALHGVDVTADVLTARPMTSTR